MIKGLKAAAGMKGTVFGGGNLYIRDYECGDCRETAELFYETVHRINSADYTEEQIEVWAPKGRDLEKWNASFKEKGKKAVIAAEGDRIVGFCDFTSSGFLDRLYVHCEFQGMGIGKALCSEAERYAASCGSSKVTVYASITAKPFFEKLGYSVIRPNEVIKEGVSLTNYFMEKNL